MSKSSVSKAYQLTPRAIYNRLEVALHTSVVPYVVANPGVGKSSLVAKLADEYGMKLIDIRASQYEPTDFSGLPTRGADGKAEYLPFNLIPLETDPLPDGYNGWILFLDEINHVRQPVVAALYKLILDRKVGEHKIHPNVKLICAGNLDSDKAQTIKLGTAFNSRVMRMEMKSDMDDWLEDFALKKGIDDRIISYLLQFRTDFHSFDPDSDHKSFCCPRSWEMVDNVIKGFQATGKSSTNNDDLDIPMLDGLLSPGIASKFVGYCDVFGNIPTLVSVITDPKGAIVPEANDACYATATSLASNTDKSNIQHITEYIKRLPKIHQGIYSTLVTKRDLSLSANVHLVNLVKNVTKRK